MNRLLAFWLLLSIHGVAADTRPLKERVDEFCGKYRDVSAIEKRHAEWIKEEPDNPDAYVLPANALAKAAESMSIVAGDQKGAIAVLTDPKTGKQVGSIAGPDVALLKRSEAIVTAGTKKFPQRLDMHVGRMAMAQRAKDIAAVQDAAFDLLSATAKDPQAMRWIDGAKIDGDPLQKALGEVKARIRWLYSFEEDETDKVAQDCALKALELAPDNVELLNFAAMRHLYRGEWKEGREYLLRAEKTAPQDWVIQHNIARASAELGDKADALKRLKAIIKAVPDTDDAKAAEQSIQALGLEPKK